MKYVVSTVQCVVCSVQCAVCSLQCAVCSVQCAVKRVALCSLQCEVSSLHCVVCSVGGQDSRASSNHGFTKDQQLLCVLYQLCCISFFFFNGGDSANGSMGDCSVDILASQVLAIQFHMLTPMLGIWNPIPNIGLTIPLLLC